MHRALVSILLASPVAADVYDLYMPKYLPAAGCKCVPWDTASSVSKTYTKQTDIDAMFIAGKSPSHAQCAMPGAHAGNHECDCGEKDAQTYISDSYAGAWCFCADGSQKYCTAPNSTVEQLNLQLAAPDTVVVAFVTYEELPSKPASAMIGTSESNMQSVEGVSHKYSPPGRTYIMHYVTFTGLTPREKYYYKVKSGTSAYTDVFTFRAPYSSGVTKLATYGDMGHSHHNNMANMKADCESGAIDAIVHMGDHAYNLGMTTDKRGDAYMNVFQPTLQTCPWLPVIGNHEGSDGDHYKRYEQIALGEMIGQTSKGHRSTATSALGQHLSLGTLYGSASYGMVPSNTSRYISVNIGMIHIAGIDLMNFDKDQIAWLDADLTAANQNRNATPWIMVLAHYQLYHVSLADKGHLSAEAFFSENAEALKNESLRWQPCTEPGCQTIRDWQIGVSSALEPLLLKHGVDIYNAGHIHDYEASWPMKGNKVCDKSYDNPRCPVYIVEGNGGVPGCPGDCKVNPCSSGMDWCRVHGSGCGAYGRITITDANTLKYEHVVNSNGTVLDTFTLTQKHHGPFEPLDAANPFA